MKNAPMKKQHLLAGATLLALFAAQPLMAQMSTETAPAQTMRNFDAATQDFVNKAWNIDNFEIRAGQHALNTTNTQAVRDFATMIVADHNKAEGDLKPLVEGARMTMPTAPGSLDKEHQANLDKLDRLSGAQFDELFKTQQIEGHEKALKLFQNYVKNGSDADIKNWAQNGVTMIEKHLAQAKALPVGAQKGARNDTQQSPTTRSVVKAAY